MTDPTTISRPRRRRVPDQCRGCGQFVAPTGTAWATGYHPECDPTTERRTR